MDLINLNKDIEFSGFKLTKTGLEINGKPTFEQWEQMGKFIKKAEGAVQWWVGDWLNYGEMSYSEWTQYYDVDDTPAKQTLANMKWVSKRVEPSRRRELSWSHHAEVAEFEPEDQDLLLDQAIQNKLNRNQFRGVVRLYKEKLELPEVNQSVSEDEKRKEEFDKVSCVVDLNCDLLAELTKIDLDSLIVDARDFMLSQFKKTVGILGNIIEKYDKPPKLSS